MTDSALSDRSRFYSVAELANEFSLTSQGIRFYEESGLIAPARVGRTRVFNYQDRARRSIDADSSASLNVFRSLRASGTTSTRP
jgi:hypothetical protein